MKTLSAAAHANAPAKTDETTKPAAAAKTGAPKSDDRVAPVIAAPRSDLTPPAGGRGGNSRSPLLAAVEALEAGQSVGFLNKTKKQISSNISKLNNAETNQRQATNTDGSAKTKAGEPIKDATGQIVSYGPAVPVMERIKEFVVHDVDPAKDPDKATVRVYRTK